MESPREVDAVIIGTGQAGPAMARALASRGESVVVFEGGLTGGSCVNVGCTPTKTLRKSARVAHLARRARDFGVHTGEVRVDFAAVMERAAGVVHASRTGLTASLENARSLTFLREWARLDGRAGDRFAVRGGAHTVHASRIYLNTGTSPFVPPIPGLGETPYLTNETVMALRERPEHLVILGGSYIGLELGQIFARLGSTVTIIESGPRVASREDPDISLRIAAFLDAEGIALLTSTTVQRVERGSSNTADAPGDGVLLHLAPSAADSSVPSPPASVRGTHLLVATGRTPNSAHLGLESVDVARDQRGFVPVNGRLETNVPGIWALGDINKRGAFTHTSYQDHEIVLANHTGGTRTADGRVMTYAMFTDPPLGRVGLSEHEAIDLMANGRRFLVARHEMKNVSRAKEEGETTGVISVLVDADTKRFVGATLLGINADEIVQVIGAMIAADASYHVLAEALPVHPTVTEFFPTILGKLQPLDQR